METMGGTSIWLNELGPRPRDKDGKDGKDGKPPPVPPWVPAPCMSTVPLDAV
jgi:hypothetical protein